MARTGKPRIPTKAITMRFHLDAATKLDELAKKYGQSKVGVINDLVRVAHKRVIGDKTDA